MGFTSTLQGDRNIQLCPWLHMPPENAVSGFLVRPGVDGHSGDKVF